MILNDLTWFTVILDYLEWFNVIYLDFFVIFKWFVLDDLKWFSMIYMILNDFFFGDVQDFFEWLPLGRGPLQETDLCGESKCDRDR